MGFRVGIDGNADALLKRLRSRPATVFDRPYKGYLLFLAGAADQQVCQWLAENALVLDSLTGGEVAFAVFAREFRFTLHTGRSQISRHPRYVGEILSEEITGGSFDVQRIVKSGRCGWVVDKDEIAAVTYAVDEIAKSFGVLGNLPCVVLLDAIPAQRINVIHLSRQVCDSFVELLRRSLQKFSVMTGYGELEASVKRILQLYQAIDIASAKERNLRREIQIAEGSLKHVESVGPVPRNTQDSVGNRLEAARKALYVPSLRDFREAIVGARRGLKANCYELLPGLDHETLTDVLEEAECQYDRLRSLIMTIESLKAARVAEESGRSERVSLILTKHVPRLLDALPVPSDDVMQKNALDQVLEALQIKRDDIINTVIGKIPSNESLMNNLESSRQDRYLHDLDKRRKNIQLLKADLETFIDDPERPVREATHRYEEAIQQYSASNPASFWKAISQTLKELKIEKYSTSFQATAVEIAAGIFRPDFLLKVWKVLVS